VCQCPCEAAEAHPFGRACLLCRVATERTTPGAGQKHVAATLRKQIGRDRGSTLRLAALAEVSESYGGGMRYG
jgi:hypothetical protein